MSKRTYGIIAIAGLGLAIWYFSRRAEAQPQPQPISPTPTPTPTPAPAPTPSPAPQPQPIQCPPGDLWCPFGYTDSYLGYCFGCPPGKVPIIDWNTRTCYCEETTQPSPQPISPTPTPTPPSPPPSPPQPQPPTWIPPGITCPEGGELYIKYDPYFFDPVLNTVIPSFTLACCFERLPTGVCIRESMPVQCEKNYGGCVKREYMICRYDQSTNNWICKCSANWVNCVPDNLPIESRVLCNMCYP